MLHRMKILHGLHPKLFHLMLKGLVWMRAMTTKYLTQQTKTRVIYLGVMILEHDQAYKRSRAGQAKSWTLCKTLIWGPIAQENRTSEQN
jgi:hypothetical protein